MFFESFKSYLYNISKELQSKIQDKLIYELINKLK